VVDAATIASDTMELFIDSIKNELKNKESETYKLLDQLQYVGSNIKRNKHGIELMNWKIPHLIECRGELSSPVLHRQNM